MSYDIRPLDLEAETLRDRLIRCGWADNYSVDSLSLLIEEYASKKVAEALAANNTSTPGGNEGG